MCKGNKSDTAECFRLAGAVSVFPISALVSVCHYGVHQELHLLTRLRTAIFTSSQAMHLGNADEQILSCGNNLVLFLENPVSGTAEVTRPEGQE